MDQPAQSSGCYDDIADYFGFAKDHPLRFYHPLWVRAIQGHTSEDITVSKHGFYNDFQEDYHQVPNYTVYQRHTVPFAMLTYVPVKLEDYEQYLVEGCVFHWTTKEAVADIFNDGGIKAGREAIYFAWNVPFAHKHGWRDHAQNWHGSPIKYKPDSDKGHSKKWKSE